MESSKQTSKDYFKGLNIVYFALIVGQLFFVTIAIFIGLNMPIAIEEAEVRMIVTIVISLLVASGISASHMIFNSKLKKIKEKSNIIEKTVEYRSVLILRYALLEGPSMLATVGYLLTGYLLFIGVVSVVITFFIILKPSKERLVFDLNLDALEKGKIFDPNEVISETNTEKLR